MKCNSMCSKCNLNNKYIIVGGVLVGIVIWYRKQFTID